VLADGKRSKVTNAVKLHPTLLDFSWDNEFKILNGGPFPVTFGLDFLRKTTMVVNVVCRSFSFGFAPLCSGKFGDFGGGAGNEPYFQDLIAEACVTAAGQSGGTRGLSAESLSAEFPAVFSPKLGTANCTPYEIEVLDPTPVRSPPYRCAPPKMVIFRETVNQLLEEGVTRPSKSPYASPAFLVPKNGGKFRLVVDYRKVNSKIVFDSYLMSTIDQALEQFGGTVIFSVLDLNSAYYQIPLSMNSQRITAFCTPFGLFEFNKLPMGISVGCQGLSRVFDELFADLKGQFVFNFLDDFLC
jgi:hypothetical protein